MTRTSDKIYQNAGNPPVLKEVPSSAHIILDVGCGAGDNARALAGQGKVIDAISASAAELEMARPWCRATMRYNLEEGLPPECPGPYDVSICSHVLEHLADPARLLRDIHRALNSQSGILIVAVPNIMHYRYRVQLLLGNFDYTDTGVMDNTHYRWYTFASGRTLLEQNGFKVLRAFGDGSFPLWKLRDALPARISTALDCIACRYRPGVFALQHIFTAVPV